MPNTYTMRSKLYRFVEIGYLSALVLLVVFHTVAAIWCSQCDSLTSKDCESVPPPPTTCAFCEVVDKKTGNCLNYTEYDFCITMKKYINDSLVSTTRACNPISIGADCRSATDGDKKRVKICFDSCITDGCNTATTFNFPNLLLYLSIGVTLNGYLFTFCDFFAS